MTVLPVTLRMACEADVPAMRNIYAPCVSDSVVSFEYEAPTLLEFQQRFLSITSRFPWIVAEVDGQVAGYIYANTPFSRPAYQWSVELSVYISTHARCAGLGKRLSLTLIDLLTLLGYAKLYALVVASNKPCLHMLANLGFEQEGCLVRSGYKFESWHDVCWLARELGNLSAAPTPPLPISALPTPLLSQCLHNAHKPL